MSGECLARMRGVNCPVVSLASEAGPRGRTGGAGGREGTRRGLRRLQGRGKEWGEGGGNRAKAAVLGPRDEGGGGSSQNHDPRFKELGGRGTDGRTVG